jgi:hypothetical protein
LGKKGVGCVIHLAGPCEQGHKRSGSMIGVNLTTISFSRRPLLHGVVDSVSLNNSTVVKKINTQILSLMK